MIPLLLAEYIFKNALFDMDNNAMAKYRKPPLYADEWDTDYWKLLQKWNVVELKSNTHPLLGWCKWNVWQKNLFHKDLQDLNGRRPVVLYGDSYAQHVDTGQTMRDLFEKDSIFNSRFKFINYGNGGYGTDQIYTMFAHTFCKMEKPIVIFSFLTLDLERSILSFRDGLKPLLFVDSIGRLAFDNSMVSMGTKRYLRLNPPEISSYLWRKFLYSKANFLPYALTERFTGEKDARERIVQLNTCILESVIQQLDLTQTDYCFLIFDAPADYNAGDGNKWRMEFIKDFFSKHPVKHFYARDLLPEPLNINDSAIFYKYFVVNDGHPTNLYYTYIVNKIKSIVINNEYTSYRSSSRSDKIQQSLCYPSFKQEKDSVIDKIRNDHDQMKEIRRLAAEGNITVDQSISNMADYYIWQQNEEYKQSLKSSIP